MKKLLTLLTLVFNSWMIAAQEDILRDLSDDFTEEDLIALGDKLSDLVENPVNLRTATREDLERIPFLSAELVENILFYNYAYGPMQTLYELQLVEGIDRALIETILPYLFLGESKSVEEVLFNKSHFSYVKSKLYIRYGRGIEQREGYRIVNDSLLRLNKCYLGDPSEMELRYQVNVTRKLEAGIRLNKGAGESFQQGVDYFTGYLLINDIKPIKRIIIGDYRLSSGQGLILNQDFSLGKNNFINSARSNRIPLKGSMAGESVMAFRGASAWGQHRDFSFLLFWSDRKIDATRNDSVITSIKKDGKHRTLGEWEKKNSAGLLSYGMSIKYQRQRLMLGASMLGYRFSLPVFPPDRTENRFLFAGRRNGNYSVDYLYSANGLFLFGEMALSANGGYALLNGLGWHPIRFMTISLLQRYYSPDYQAYFAKSFSSGGRVQNEEGYYMGIVSENLRDWKFTAYLDFFRFPWLKSGAAAPSKGFEYLVQSEYRQRNYSLRLSYKHVEKERNPTSTDDEHADLVWNKSERIRLQGIFNALGIFVIKPAIEYLWNTKGGDGWLFTSSLDWNPAASDFRGTLSYSYFDTDDSSLTVAGNERNMPYSFYVPRFYGSGTRLALMGAYSPWNVLTIYVKYGLVRYDDRLLIGSGLEQIQGRVAQEVTLQMKFAF